MSAPPASRLPLWLAGALALSPAPVLAARPATLPAQQVMTNLRSPTGRGIYLLLRAPAEGAKAEGRFAQAIERSAKEMAAQLGAKLKLRQAGPLWVLILQHETAGLDVHRRGEKLSVDAGAQTSLSPGATAGLHLRAEQPDGDLDQEIMLNLRNVRDREEVPAQLVTLAQGSAARILLTRYAQGDDVGAVLWGQRYLPLLSAHPDVALLKEVISAVEQEIQIKLAALEAEPDPAGAAAQAQVPPGWTAALAEAGQVAAQAARSRRPSEHPPEHKEKGKKP